MTSEVQHVLDPGFIKIHHEIIKEEHGFCRKVYNKRQTGDNILISLLKKHIEEMQNSFNINIKELKNSDIVTVKEFRKACEQNFCGQYNKNWMCPPAVGKIDDLISSLSQYCDGVLIQTIHKISDSYDIEGMKNAKDNHDKVISRMKMILEEETVKRELLILSAGECSVCKDCTYITNKECRFPDKAIASVESYGIDVNSLLLNCGLEYNNGMNTVSYVGIVMKNKFNRHKTF